MSGPWFHCVSQEWIDHAHRHTNVARVAPSIPPLTLVMSLCPSIGDTIYITQQRTDVYDLGVVTESVAVAEGKVVAVEEDLMPTRHDFNQSWLVSLGGLVWYPEPRTEIDCPDPDHQFFTGLNGCAKGHILNDSSISCSGRLSVPSGMTPGDTERAT